MDPTTEAGIAGTERLAVAITPPADAPATMSTSDAARLLASLRKRKTDAASARADTAVAEQGESPAQAHVGAGFNLAPTVGW